MFIEYQIIPTILIGTYSLIPFALGGLFHFYFRQFAVKKDFSYKPSVSILLSCYNEGEAVYKTIESLVNSNYPKDKLEILAFDDCSKDDSFFWLEKAAEDFPCVIAKRNSVNKGKAHTQVAAAMQSTGEVLLGIDSDCYFDPNAISELVSCFSEPNIAAVGGQVGVSNANANWLTRFQAYEYSVVFLFSKGMESFFRKIQCLSGAFLAIKREPYFKVLPDIVNREFLGLKVPYGEDRWLTQMLLSHGYGTYMNPEALCFTEVPSKVSVYLNQQLRWRKGALNCFFSSLFQWSHFNKNRSLFCFFLACLPALCMLSWLALFIDSWLSNNLFTLLCFSLKANVVATALFGLFYFATKKSLPYKFDFGLAAFAESQLLLCLWYPINGLVLTTFSFLTLDNVGWATRGSVPAAASRTSIEPESTPLELIGIPVLAGQAK